jgi:phosphoenolpyruvate synthase/pyruvate phosphate dikinase
MLLPHEKAVRTAPYISRRFKAVYETVMAAEDLFGTPQDVEWTFADDRLYVLQSRPITTLSKDRENDDRGWYLSLRRSFENLKSLRKEIEGRLIPEMIEEAKRLSSIDLKPLNASELAGEIERRVGTYSIIG